MIRWAKMITGIILVFLFVGYLQQGITVRVQRSQTRHDLTNVSLMSPNDMNLTVSQGEPMAITMTLECSGLLTLDDYISVFLYKIKMGSLLVKHEVDGMSHRCIANKFCIDVHISGLQLTTTIIIADSQFRDSGEYMVSVKTRKKDESKFLDQGNGKFDLHVIQGENGTERCNCRRKKRGPKRGRKAKSKITCNENDNTECP